MNMAKIPPLLALLMLTALCLLPEQTLGHAFPDHSEPRVGSTVDRSPDSVRIWFDGALEAAFCTLSVEDGSGARLDKGDGTVDPADLTLLKVTLPRLPAGTYHVRWEVLARDGHRTKGDYSFEIR